MIMLSGIRAEGNVNAMFRQEQPVSNAELLDVHSRGGDSHVEVKRDEVRARSWRRNRPLC